MELLACVPELSVPSRLPSIELLPAPVTRMPALSKPWMTRPRTIELPPPIESPTADVVACPSSSIRPAGTCVVPSMVTGPVSAGSAVAGVIFGIPNVAMRKEIASAPAARFASVIACRREPAPESDVFVTWNVAARAGDAPSAQPRASAIAARTDVVRGPRTRREMCKGGASARPRYRGHKSSPGARDRPRRQSECEVPRAMLCHTGYSSRTLVTHAACTSPEEARNLWGRGTTAGPARRLEQAAYRALLQRAQV